MIIIEAGATSTKVCQILNNKGSTVKVYEGINPSYMAEKEIIPILEKALANLDADDSLIYYGTGCYRQPAQEKMRRCFEAIQGLKHLTITSDLLAAARATAGDKAGQINILGTGSASCLYTGQDIEKPYFNTGYLFGDYGSGYALGQALLTAYFQEEFEVSTMKAITQFSGLEKQVLLQKIYESKSPKSFIASFSKCVHSLKKDTLVELLIRDSFSKFIEHQIKRNPLCTQMPQYFVGSISHYFEDELTSTLKDNGLVIAGICKNPIKNLINYHLI